MSEQKYWPCEHINKSPNNSWIYMPYSIMNYDMIYHVSESAKFCIYCGAKRPEPQKDWLVDIISEYCKLTTFTPFGIEQFAKEIRAYIKENGPHVNGSRICDKEWLKFMGCE